MEKRISTNEIEAAQETLGILKKEVDSNTLLLLSGGNTPKKLYQLIAEEKILKPGAVALVDERFGEPMHDQSNELMIQGTGLLDYFEQEGVPVFKILEGQIGEQTALDYQNKLINLLKKYPKKVAVVGLGGDGHTSGIKPNLDYDHNRLVVYYNDAEGHFGERITTTFEALEKIGVFILLVLGQEKKEAIEKSFSGSDQKSIPGVFYKNTKAEVYLITDQRI